MLEIGLYIVAGLVALILLFVALVIMRPAEFRITRSARIAGSAAAIFDQVNDFHKWNDWSPWHKLDPNMKQTFEGPAAGTGTIYSWHGNKDVGEGRMTIIDSRPSDLIRIKLEFLKPWTATNDTEFTFKPDNHETVVTWTMTGRNNFMAKAFTMLMNMDKMIGRDFEKGLAQMKTLVEASGKR